LTFDKRIANAEISNASFGEQQEKES